MSPRLRERAVAIEHGVKQQDSVPLVLFEDALFLVKLACLPHMGRLARPPIVGHSLPRVPAGILFEALCLVGSLGNVSALGLGPSVQGCDGMLGRMHSVHLLNTVSRQNVLDALRGHVELRGLMTMVRFLRPSCVANRTAAHLGQRRDVALHSMLHGQRVVTVPLEWRELPTNAQVRRSDLWVWKV